MKKEELKTEERYLDILNFQGDVLFSIKLREYKHKPDNEEKSLSSGSKPKPNSQNNGDGMTEPQRKLLFRIYAGKGIAVEEAHEQIKKLFKVKHLQDITKIEASKKIESLLNEAKGGNGNGSPIK